MTACLVFLVTLSSGLSSSRPVVQELVPDPGVDAIARECLTAVSGQLLRSGGKFTPEVRSAYLDWCWNKVLRDLQQQGKPIAAECISEVASDPELKVAVSAAVYPPDPSILQNYSAIRSQMGAAFTAKYRATAIAFSVARRIGGIEDDNGQSVGRENQIPIWAYQPLRRIDDGSEKRVVHLLAEYLRSKNLAALDVFNSDEERRRIAAYLALNHVEQHFVDEVGRNPLFGERLKNALIEMGKRPAARSPKPGCIDWLKYLVKIQETSAPSTPTIGGHPLPWPLCSMSGTPWPLLMSLSHPAPMDEAQYLWETFIGRHGSDRFHTYGPYRDDLQSMPDQLVPSRWFFNAVPDQVVHGGQCMPISLATVDLYASLGKPSTDAAQPGHANLLTYQKDGGSWKTDIEQDFAGGCRVTFSQWFFCDPPRHELHFRDLFGWPGGEYHIGLSLGMNLGVDSYIDTRIAARIFDVLPGAAKPTLGAKLLESALLENPFNPEVWYRLADVTTDVRRSVEIGQAIRNHDPAKMMDGKPCSLLQKFLTSGGAGPAGWDMDVYWTTLQEFVARNAILGRAASQDEETMHSAYTFLRGVPGLDGGDLVSYVRRFTGVKSEAVVAKEVQYDLNLAGEGDLFGCMRMGRRYLDGEGVPRDESKARDYLTRAARQGDPSAAAGLESLYSPISIDGVQLTASSTYSPTQDVHHLVDGSGMNGGAHDNSVPAATMWQTVDNPTPSEPAAGLPPSPAWVRFNFPQPRTFDAVLIWNHNQLNLTDRGFRRFVIYGSADGVRWLPLTKDAFLPRAGGTASEPGVEVPTNSSGRLFRSVIIAANSKEGNYGSRDYGLSAVRFVFRPVNQSVPAYQIEVQASSTYSMPAQEAQHLINGAGMTGEFHDNERGAGTMWQTGYDPQPSSAAPTLPKAPAWVRFNFTTPRYFDSIRIWNHNQLNLTERGFKKMRIFGTSDGVEWFSLTAPEVVQLPRATGAALAASTTYFNAVPERPIRSVVIAAEPVDGNYGANCYGLSAVRFIMK